MNNSIVIVGGFASGKTTLAKYLEAEKGYKRIVTCTTRPIRDGEVSGEDYVFLTEAEFINAWTRKLFAEVATYDMVDGRVYYGSLKASYNTGEKTVVVLTPSGVMAFETQPFTVWLDLPQETIMKRAFDRGDLVGEIVRRVIADHRDFEPLAISEKYDLRIHDEIPVEDLAELVIRFKQKEGAL